jgi:hypothetical protein
VKKIRNFKLRLHFKDLRHRGRKRFDMTKMGLGEDTELKKFLDSVEARLTPAVIYETFGADSEDTTEISSLKGLAHTLGLANLGPGLSELLVEVEEVSEERGKFLKMVCESALSQAVTFVTRLLKDEVEQERCELSPTQYIEDPEAVKKIFNKLEGGKIDLSLEGETLSPEYSAAFCLSWVLKRRAKKKAKSTSRRR